VLGPDTRCARTAPGLNHKLSRLYLFCADILGFDFGECNDVLDEVLDGLVVTFQCNGVTQLQPLDPSLTAFRAAICFGSDEWIASVRPLPTSTTPCQLLSMPLRRVPLV
jgi:hypothetical protein